MITDTSRPRVRFNASDPEHRLWFKRFLETNSWADCPVQFEIPPQYLEIPHYISRELSRYYLSQDPLI